MQFVLKKFRGAKKFYKKEQIVQTNLQRAFELKPKIDLVKLFKRNIVEEVLREQKREENEKEKPQEDEKPKKKNEIDSFTRNQKLMI